MSTEFTGDASQITTPITRTINGATNASPIVISTTANHLYATGDRVTIAIVGGNTAANGTWTITKVGASTFSLNGSTGSGAYTSGGTAVNNSLTPQFQIPADGDDLEAASINVALEALADRTQYLATEVCASRLDEFLSSGTWTCPPNVYSVDLEMCGGGAGGGLGSAGDTADNSYAVGGGGGGGALLVRRRVSVTPGVTYTVTVGAGGAGAASAGIGTAGGYSSFGSLATAKGAIGGAGFTTKGDASNTVMFSGGCPAASATFGGVIRKVSTSNSFDAGLDVVRQPGHGGWGLDKRQNSPSQQGCNSVEGYTGGTYGTLATTDASKQGGGGGGGGAAGPYGNGGAGGAGGAGNNSGAGSVGGNGTNAAANTGAGGGGSGAGGAGTSGGAVGTPGNGGSGRVYVAYVGPQATVA